MRVISWQISLCVPSVNYVSDCVAEKLSWFIRHLSDGLYIFYSKLWNLSSDIWALLSEMSDMSDDFHEHCHVIIRLRSLKSLESMESWFESTSSSNCCAQPHSEIFQGKKAAKKVQDTWGTYLRHLFKWGGAHSISQPPAHLCFAWAIELLHTLKSP